MKKQVGLLLLLFFALCSTAFAQDQEYILDWRYDEGSGTVAFDSSGNGIFGILLNGAVFNTGSGAFGAGDVNYGTSNDIVQGAINLEEEGNFSISWWTKVTLGSNYGLWNIQTSDGINYLTFTFDRNDAVRLQYSTSPTTWDTEDIQTGLSLSTNTYYHQVLTFNRFTKDYEYYRDGSLIATGDIANSDLNLSNYIFRTGTNEELTQDLQGSMDEFKIFNFIVNSSQVTELYNSNTITLAQSEDPEDPGIIPESGTIIDSFFPPQNFTTTSPVDFSIQLIQPANCELYLDGEIETAFANQVAFVYEKLLAIGDHEYFWYCSYIQNSTQTFELTSVTEFEITGGTPLQITFEVEGNDFDVNDVELTLLSPCPEEGFSAIGLKDFQPYRAKFNPGGIKFVPFENGIASMTGFVGDNEFCIFNGRLHYADENVTTTDYDIVEFNGMVELGVISVPNNVSPIYNVKLDLLETYEITDPKAWGQTWAGIIGGILLLFFGVLTLIAGLETKNGKIVIAAAFLILSAFGVSLPPLLAMV